MDRDADIYAALGDADDALWTADQKGHIEELSLFNVRQPYALLLAARRALAEAEFTRVLRACAVVSFRYNVIGNLAANEQERVYNAVAGEISRQELRTANEVVRALRPVYPTDEQFRAAFAEKQFRTTTSRNRQIVRYVLFAIERQASGRSFDHGSDRYNIEHVLPEHPGDGWSTFSDEQLDRCVCRLGNLALLATGANRDMGNLPFGEKKLVYAQSEFEITRRIAADNQDWTTENIAARQRWLASQATAIWKLSELS